MDERCNNAHLNRSILSSKQWFIFYIHLGRPDYFLQSEIGWLSGNPALPFTADYPVGCNEANRAAFQSHSKQHKLQLEVTDKKPQSK